MPFIPQLSIALQAKSILFGLGIGVIMALTGAGGGILSIPVLMVGLGMDMSNAKPLSLLAVGLGAAMGAMHGLRMKLLHYRAVLYMSLLGILMAPLGIWLSRLIGQQTMAVVFGGVLVLAGWRSLRVHLMPSSSGNDKAAPYVPRPCAIDPGSGRVIWTPASFAILGLIGAVTGLLSGMLGVGGGFFMVPMLSHFTNLRYQNILVTSLGVIALVSGFSALEMLSQGTPIASASFGFVAAAVVGMLLGRVLAPRISSGWLHASFGIAVLLAAALLLIRTFFPLWINL
jgi:uncharacterized membrane protein YfcA